MPCNHITYVYENRQIQIVGILFLLMRVEEQSIFKCVFVLRNTI